MITCIIIIYVRYWYWALHPFIFCSHLLLYKDLCTLISIYDSRVSSSHRQHGIRAINSFSSHHRRCHWMLQLSFLARHLLPLRRNILSFRVYHHHHYQAFSSSKPWAPFVALLCPTFRDVRWCMTSSAPQRLAGLLRPLVCGCLLLCVVCHFAFDSALIHAYIFYPIRLQGMHQ